MRIEKKVTTALLGKWDLVRSINIVIVVDVDVPLTNLFANVIKKFRYPRAFFFSLFLDAVPLMITKWRWFRPGWVIERKRERKRGWVRREKGSDLTISRQWRAETRNWREIRSSPPPAATYFLFTVPRRSSPSSLRQRPLFSRVHHHPSTVLTFVKDQTKWRH